MDVLIAEDHAVTAKLIAKHLQSKTDINLVGIAKDGENAVSEVLKKHVDVILMDVNMPFMDGIKAAEKILKSKPDVKVLFLSVHTEPWIIKQTINVGGAGYVSKKHGFNKIYDAIVTVFQGDPYLDDTSLKSIVDDFLSDYN